MVERSPSEFNPANLVELLRWRAQRQPEKLAYRYLVDGDDPELTLTYDQLDTAAHQIAAHLQDMGMHGARALLLYPPGLDYITAFFGCLYAGVVAVPAFPPRLNRPIPRIQAIVADSQARVALTTTSILNNIESRLEHAPELSALAWLNTEQLDPGSGPEWQPPQISPDVLAFLQYTSGSTSTPKGVMLSHGNLIHNLKIIRHGFQIEEGSMGVFWLPSYHDMGLIGGILEPMYVGEPSTLMSPASFLQRPRRWLKAITDFRGTISGAPNFAYDLCVDKISQDEREGLDLSTWKTAFCGAEPVRLETLERFAEAFEPYGFDRNAFYPCYGLAEGTLIVSGREGARWPAVRRVRKESLKQNRVVLSPELGDQTQVLVSSGGALPDQRILIVDPETRMPCGPERVGEIWVAGPSVAGGYWCQPEETARSFGAHLAETGEGPFLRTGDLGFLQEDELFVTGRLKDLIIIHGRNHYPQDIEQTVARSHLAFQPNAGAAFSVEVDGEERLVIVHELAREHRNADADEIFVAVRRAVAEHHELQVYALVLLKPLSIPMTSSGKVRRHACKADYLTGSLKAIAGWQSKDAPAAAALPPSDGGTRQEREALTVQSIRSWLIHQLAARTGTATAQIDPREPFALYGLDSVEAVGLAADLEIWLGRTLSPTLAWDYPSIEALSHHLAGDAPHDRLAMDLRPGESFNEPVAVVGIGCRFPQAGDPEGFWQLLQQGIDAIREVPADRWNIDQIYAPEAAVPGKTNTRWGSFLSNVADFEPAFFGISPREAARMDPQQRLLLEVAWEALEYAGQAPDRLAGSRTGVFVGISSYDYSRIQFSDPAGLDAYAGTGNAHSIAANRLSYTFDLRGPSMAIDTACSSSLVAVHLAMQSLRRGDADLALAGGVNLILSPELTITFSQARMMAPDGRCKTFDARADGYVRGEGCGIVVLKRLSDALRDGDNILALLRGSAVNQDGRTNGLTAPNGPSQQAVIRQALQDAGVQPAQIGYVEAHGTGTPLGDPIEIDSLRRVLEDGRPAGQPYGVGSVKTNIGHLEAAAGIAGLIKVVLSLMHDELPAHLHFRELNPYIALDGSQLEILTERRGWPRGAAPRLAGVSSFGFGGTNAHVVLSEAPLLDEIQPEGGSTLERPLHLIRLSARSETALKGLAARYRSRLEQLPAGALPDFCYSANVGRADFDHRLAAVAGSAERLESALRAFAAGGRPAGLRYRYLKSGSRSGPAFIFTGQGSQYPQMGRRLYETQPVFRSTLERCAEVLAGHLDRPLLSILFPPAEDFSVDETRYTQPALFALEYALAELWRSWGIEPAAVMGHSVGEYAAACIAGVFSLEDGLKLIAARGRLMQALPADGAMAAVFADRGQVEAALSGYEDRLAIAAVNGPDHVVVSGEAEALNEVLEVLENGGLSARLLNVSQAFHSPLMEPMLEAFEKVARQVTFRSPQIPMISNLTGAVLSPGAVPDARYWRRHVRETVQFAAGIDALAGQNSEVWLEIGPGPVLTGMGRRALAGREPFPAWVHSLQRGRDDWEVMLDALGELYLQGVEIDWAGFDAGFRRRKMPLPTYPFERQRFWLDLGRQASAQAPALNGDSHPVLGQRLRSPLQQYETRLDLAAAADPAAALRKLAQAAAEELYGPGAHRLTELELIDPVSISNGAALVQTVLSPDSEGHMSAAIHTMQPDQKEWRLLARFALAPGEVLARDSALEALPPAKPASEEPLNRNRLLKAKGDERRALVDDFLRAQVAGVLGLAEGDLASNQPLDTLGLDSLMAIELKNSLETTLGVVLPIVNFLEGPTIADLSTQVERGLAMPLKEAGLRLEASGDPHGDHPLSHNQQALWFLRQLAPPRISFNVSGAVAVHGELKDEYLRQAFQRLVDRHAALRTVFKVVDGEPKQHILERLEAPVEILDASAWDDGELRDYLDARAFEPFDLETGPAFRIILLRRGSEEAAKLKGAASAPGAVLLLAMDHIISDFWSVSVLAQEALEAYQALTADRHLAAEPLPVQYVDYVRWQHAMLESPAGASLSDYWARQLGGELPLLDLPTDRPRPALQTFEGGSQAAVIDASMTEGLKQLAKEHNATLYMVLLAAFQALLHRYSGQDEFLVGSVTAGRGQPELAELVGYFVNPIALRADFTDNPTFAELVAQVRQTVMEAIEHQDYPPALLAEKLGIRRDPSRPPLFETMFIFQKAQLAAVSALSPFALGIAGGRLQVGDLVLESLPLEGQPAQFDLTLMMAELEGKLGASLQYNANLFEAGSVRRLLRHFESLLAGVLADPNRPLSGIPFLAEEERHQILVAWNATRIESPAEACVHQAFEAQAARTPDSVAVVFEGRELSYSELNRRANQLAHHLQELGVGPGALVGICLDRSLEMVVGLLGTLKAGGAYVPLDPGFPAARLELMLEVAQPRVLLAEEGHLASLPADHARVICVDRDREAIAGADDGNPESTASAEDLAYVIFTSGSTGVPKGVQVSHGSVTNFLNSMRLQPGLTEKDTLLAVTTLSFDIAVLELLLPLTVGAKVELLGGEAASDGALLLGKLSSTEASMMQATPATWRMLLEAGWAPQPGDQVSREGPAQNGRKRGLKILCGGEPLSRELAEQLLARGREVWNMYGPTETTVWSTIERVRHGEGPVSIGRPIGNTQVYVLDPELQPVPVGTAGELYIGGQGVARGYLNRDELTAEKFVPNPFQPEPAARLYRTGDLARFRPDGSLMFLGRADQQVKVRGFRIELGDIETALAKHESVRECAVLAREEAPGDMRLTGYLVLKDEADDPSVSMLRAFLKRWLPDYMLPSAFVTLPALPLTPNGKLDRRRLPAPAHTRAALKAPYAAPRDEQEREIAAIGSEVLGVQRIGVHDDFFDLGGNSLLATRLIFLLQEQFEVKIPLARLFETPTIEGLSQAIEAARSMTGDEASLFGTMTMEQLNAEAVPDPSIGVNGLVYVHRADPRRIFLTGATGFVGAFLLSDLLRQTRADIHCLVRAPDEDAGLDRILRNLATYDRPVHGDVARIRPVIGDLAQPRLGLSAETFDELARELDVLFHNGALVNFIHPYEAHKRSNVDSTRELLKLASVAQIKPVHFVSTLAIFLSGSNTTSTVWYEDSELSEVGVPYGGYAQSKWVAEKLLRAASSRGIPVSIYRAGPIAGHSQSGVWNRHDMIGSLVKACISLGAVPDLNLMLDIVPVDYVSKAIVHLGQQADSHGKAFNLSSPQQINFTELIDLVDDLGYPIRKIPFNDWKAELFDMAMRQPSEDWQVFLPLINAIDVDAVSMPRFDQTNTVAGLKGSGISSPSLGPELLKTYFTYFVESGHLPSPS